MDNDVEIAALEAKLGELQSWRNSSVTKEIFARAQEEQEKAIDLLCNVTIRDVASFFAHFEAAGHLRGLRQMPNEYQEAVAEVEQQLKELKDEPKH